MSLKENMTKEELETIYDKFESKGILKIEIQEGNVKVYDKHLFFKWIMDKLESFESRLLELEKDKIANI